MQRRHILHDDITHMEYALLIDNENDYRGKILKNYHLSWGDNHNQLRSADNYLQQIANEQLGYLYFGNEFCEYRIPDVEKLKKISDLCKKEVLSLVLVTPAVTDFGIQKIEVLLEAIISEKLLLDLVVNDVGVLELVHKKFPQIHCIAGRIFDKTTHDSRATFSEFDTYYGEKGKRYSMMPGLFSQSFFSVCQEYGINRFEFDLPKNGLIIPDHANCSLYWPYSYLTTGRVCYFRSLGLNKNKKHLVGDHNCKQLCRKYYIEKRKPLNGIVIDNGQRIKEEFLFQRGNTVFFVNNMDNKSFLKELEQFNRLIIQL